MMEEEEKISSFDSPVNPSTLHFNHENDGMPTVRPVDGYKVESAHGDETLLWQARTGLNMDSLCGAIETIIFMSDKAIPLTKIKNSIDSELPLSVVHDCISRLQEEYERSHHGIRLMEVAEGFQFRTKALYSKYIQNLFKVSSLVLTPVNLEVLAIVAYKQPISRSDIDKVRGVDSSHILRTLLDKKLVKVIGRSDDLGRPVLYGTTQEFLEVFSLKGLEDLPPEYEVEAMIQSSSVGEISDIKNLVQKNDFKRFTEDDLFELDELSKNIDAITVETSFTKGLKSQEMRETAEEKKSAFDLLEDFIVREEVIKQNKSSVESVSWDIYGHQILGSTLEAESESHPLSESGQKSEESEFLPLGASELASLSDFSNISGLSDLSVSSPPQADKNVEPIQALLKDSPLFTGKVSPDFFRDGGPGPIGDAESESESESEEEWEEVLLELSEEGPIEEEVEWEDEEDFLTQPPEKLITKTSSAEESKDQAKDEGRRPSTSKSTGL